MAIMFIVEKQSLDELYQLRSEIEWLIQSMENADKELSRLEHEENIACDEHMELMKEAWDAHAVGILNN